MTVYLLSGNLDFRKKAASINATFTFDPTEGTIANGNDFNINILIDTNNKNVVGADLVVGFDPKLVTVVDSDPAKAGIQISSGRFFTEPLVLANKVEGDKIYLSINSFTPFKGADVFGTIKFHSKKAGELKLNFANGQNKITEQGTAQNIFANPISARFMIEGSGGLSEATPEANLTAEENSIDLNHDNKINEADLQLFSKKLGATKDIKDVDFNQDGKVDKSDQEIFMAKYKAIQP